MKPTEQEVEMLIKKHLDSLWIGDKESDGIHRIMEILRWAAQLEVEFVIPPSQCT